MRVTQIEILKTVVIGSDETNRFTIVWTMAKWFIPLTVRLFYTMIAVPVNWNIPRDEASDIQYNDWMATMSLQERTRLATFQENFLRLAKVFMKDSNITVLIFRCSVGTFLSFPANICYHATVTMSLSSQTDSMGKCRDLLIVYPMVGD